jgi:hypothetical protein
MIYGTVALPVWKSKDIAWLCMESLCRMNKPKHKWELIVLEEQHQEECGVEFYKQYVERLWDAGCRDFKHLTSAVKIPLSQKWVTIAKKASSTSRYFCLCAADNYYSPFMLLDAEKDIKKADWCLTTKGFFYDFNYNKVLRFDWYSSVGLQMIARTELVRKFPMDVVNKGVDMWFARNIGSNVLINNDHWKGVLCTNGMNTISTERAEFFEDPIPPYYETDMELENIVPLEITNQIKTLCQKLQLS